jgi:hypothetical protein
MPRRFLGNDRRLLLGRMRLFHLRLHRMRHRLCAVMRLFRLHRM